MGRCPVIDFEAAKQEFLDENIELAESPEVVAAFLTIILLFGAATQDCTRKEKKALYEARLLLKKGSPLPDVARAIFDAKGPEWEVPDATMVAIAGLNTKEE